MKSRAQGGILCASDCMVIAASVAGSTWAAAETIDVKAYGKLDLAPFAYTDVSRSSFINRACYDKFQ